ncbi:ATPase [Candidatus Epulonipiscium fishelsonii]|uniref:ATPase n=1 Tax=Candidatus Epulonipiscium fishelsonii TaxID=77094 RepID=A0ACC8XA86_9FIRM|nr:ATPase [Epulopiscium sp. SCG-B11WGA-EpuloA1]ONI42020.1 ATPase [Epulopiscium sp. SCG-B05WGA-EpuloA1]
MVIKNMFTKKVDRDIKGVIKVGQGDDESVKQELEEYVVTRELSKHFAEFFASYKKGILGNTDKMGVWISGFFGSGKSHFLKILSYLLENRVVDGKTAIQYFIDDNKISDQLVLADMQLAADNSADVILFNIDSKSSMPDRKNNKEAILSVFLKVFNQHLGFYGDNPYIADLERALTKENKYQLFKDTYLELNGEDWEDARCNFLFSQDGVCETLVKIEYCSIESARNMCEKFTGTYDIDINSFAKRIKKHIDENGGKHQVVFLVDEIGQYIGERTDLMLNLQTVAEDLGTECGGKAWIIVTSQQDIDSITTVRGNDFSKIQGRFDTRLSLSSADVSEVIKKRILEKTEIASQNLKLQFKEKELVIRNLIMFNDGVEKKLYKNKEDFASIYPFIPYQFNLLGDVLTSIRIHGASGKHLAEGERSMLALFRESAIGVMNKDESALVPFSDFYNALEGFLDHSHRIVIARAWDNGMLNPDKDKYCFEVEVLKTLFMIKYVDTAITANVDNITSLMATEIDQSRIELKEKVDIALQKLCRQNYAQRSGEIYVFLSNEEQEINREIENQPVELSEITSEISNLIFNKIFPEAKYKCEHLRGRYAIGINQFVDNKPHKSNQHYDIDLNILTPDYDGPSDETTLRVGSGQGSYVWVKLPDDRAFINEIRAGLKIDKYLKLNKTSVATKYEQITDAKKKELRDRRNYAEIFLNESLKDSTIYTNSDILQTSAKDITRKLNEGIGKLVKAIYHKMGYITVAMGEAEIKAVLQSSSTQQNTLENTNETPNALALDDASQFIATNTGRHIKTSVKTLKERFQKPPYGFIEADVEWIMAKLFKQGEITFTLNQESITLLNKQPDEIYKYLTKREFSEKLLMEKREKANDKQKRAVKRIAKELFNVSSSDTDDDSILRNFKRLSENMKQEIEKMEIHYSSESRYPGQQVVKNGKKLLVDIIGIDNSTEFFRTLGKSVDVYLDFAEDFTPIKAFFDGEQKNIWDKTLNFTKIYEDSKTFITNEEIEGIITNVNAILNNKNPYREIKRLPELLDNYRNLYSDLLEETAKPILLSIGTERKRVLDELKEKQCAKLLNAKVNSDFDELQEKAKTCNNIAVLQTIKVEADALKIRLLNQIASEETRLQSSAELTNQNPTPTDTLPKQQKVISIKTVNRENTWRIETEQDVDRYIEKLREDLKNQVKENVIINIEF